VTKIVVTGLVSVMAMREAQRSSDRDGRHKAGHDVAMVIAAVPIVRVTEPAPCGPEPVGSEPDG
jgi:hypothetical protein